MSLDSLSSLHRAELREIIRTQVRASLQREGQPRPEGESVPELSGEIMARLDELPADIKEHLLKTWLSSRLPLDPDIILPLLGEIQEYDNPELQQQLITAAAFLKREGMPLRRFLLRPLAGLNTLSAEDSDSSWRKGISPHLNVPEPEILSRIGELVTSGRGREAAQMLEDLAESMEKLLQELFQIHGDRSGEGADSSQNLTPQENQLFSSLIGLRILNLAGNLGEESSLLLYLEWPPLQLQSDEERLIMTVTEQNQDGESDGKEDSGPESFHSISLFVEREELGSIRTELEVHGRDIYLKFSVDRKDTEERVKENLHRLRRNLNRSDFALQRTTVEWEEKIAPQSSAARLMEGNISPEDEEDLGEILNNYKSIDFRA